MSSRVKEDVQKLFEFWCEVTKAENGNILKQAGHIIESFPEGFKDDQIISKIPEFAYPCEFENESVQTYSFVLTSDDSKWRFGFCRHDPKTQSAMVIITYLPWHDTFLRLLGVLGELRRKKNNEFESFLSEAYSKGVPEPGASLKLFYNGGENHFIFQRPSQFQLPSIPENHNLNLYYNFVDPKNMISVFAAMLSERRIIFTSRRLDRLSSCIQAANAFLYPMVWQHIFIPVLPMKLKDILSAPMPYLIGVPEAVLETMTPEELGEVVILNCDKKSFESPFDDVQEMPPDLVHQMKKSLSNSHDHIGDRVSRIFLVTLVHLIGGYRDAVRFPFGQKIQWDEKAFIESRPQHLRPFLTRMMDLQIFQQFIEERIQMLSGGLGLSDEFELETLKQAEKIGRRGRNYKEFLRNVKDKTNPAVKSAVKSVKEGSRGVKTAYKDLKSKFRDVTPPKSQFHIQTSTLHNFSGSSAHHRSAPNSPVISRRQTTPDYSLSINQGGTLPPVGTSDINFLTTSTSNSFIQNGCSAEHTFLNSNNNNSNLNISPTVSPSSSLCSSDMNLTQELQNHPLFKSPAVDRSLKPSTSLDCGRLNSPRYGSAIKPPSTLQHSNKMPATRNHIGNSNTASSTELTGRSPKSHTAALDVPKSKLCIIDLDEVEENKDGFAIVATKSIFDVPPDKPSPPVPPRRTNSNRNINRKNNNNNNYNKTSSETSNNNNNIKTKEFCDSAEEKHLNEFADNFVVDIDKTCENLIEINDSQLNKMKISDNNLNESKIKDIFPTKLPPSRPNKNRHHNGMQRQQQQNQNQSELFKGISIENTQIPIPTPRQKSKEPSKSCLQMPNTDAAVDLIILDDGNSSSNNTSFDIEDFDPLNQNAKPIPHIKLGTQSKSPVNSAARIASSSPIPITMNHRNVFASTNNIQGVGNADAIVDNTYASSIASSTIPTVHGQILPYFTPQHNRNNQYHGGSNRMSTFGNSIANSQKNGSDDDIELLRKYGLDQFSFTVNGKLNKNENLNCNNKSDGIANGIQNTNISTSNPVKNWTTFD